MHSDSGVGCKAKRVRDGLGARAKKRLQYFLTRAFSGVPDTVIPCDWFIFWFIALLPTF